LHYLFSHIFWFQVGSYDLPNNVTIFGDLPRFLAGDPTAGIYMAGLYPMMMFALPAVAFAIIQEARKEERPRIRKSYLSAALTSFITGVTEPIEFAFLFAAPVLFVVHAVLSGVMMWLTYWLGIRHGFSFSAGGVDYLLNFYLSSKGWLIIPLGLGMGTVYYGLFRWAIRRFDIQTPGREAPLRQDFFAEDITARAPLVLEALGGKDNLVQLEACITRLRLGVKDRNLVDFSVLRALGAAGIIDLGGGNMQVVFGTYSELIREEIEEYIQSGRKQTRFFAPMQGHMVKLANVPDPVFAEKVVGDGVAFRPERGMLVAPLDAQVTIIFPTRHAIGLRTRQGLEILLHIGIDSAHAEVGFVALVAEGDYVRQGQELISFSLARLKMHAKSIISPMLITNPDRVLKWSIAPYKQVNIGQTSVMAVVLKDEDRAGGNHG
jgi:PTS system D-glucosamine-specific IIC component